MSSGTLILYLPVLPCVQNISWSISLLISSTGWCPDTSAVAASRRVAGQETRIRGIDAERSRADVGHKSRCVQWSLCRQVWCARYVKCWCIRVRLEVTSVWLSTCQLLREWLRGCARGYLGESFLFVTMFSRLYKVNVIWDCKIWNLSKEMGWGNEVSRVDTWKSSVLVRRWASELVSEEVSCGVS